MILKNKSVFSNNNKSNITARVKDNFKKKYLELKPNGNFEIFFNTILKEAKSS
jgi:hypothetical protein